GELLVARDEDFWVELNARFRQKLVRFVGFRLYAVLRRDETAGYAQDIVNDTFQAAYHRFDTFDPQRGPLEAWLFGIAAHKTADFLRSHKELKSEQFLDEMTSDVEAAPTESEFLYAKEAKSNPKTVAFRKALKRLSRYEQTLLLCRLSNKMTYAEI